MNKQIAIVGIGTEVGKTLVSAIATIAFSATYWKPIQTGYLNGEGDIDSRTVRGWTNATIYPEAYLLQEPLSPHIAAQIDEVEIDLSKLLIPKDIEGNLIIETAGGLMVPINDQSLYLDIIQQWNIPVILTMNQYLGNINHTILSIEMLKSKNIPILGIVSNGVALPDTNRWIAQYSKVPIILEIPILENITAEVLQDLAAQLKINIENYGVE
ncbi:MAG TPA: dethiobiotin synthase [Chitinophagales bacterium]|nr:dethiobiotin synthase [Chitinophagales bacterium]